MRARPLAPDDPDDSLEALRERVTVLARLAGLLDSVGNWEKAAELRAQAADLAHRFHLLRSGGGAPTKPPTRGH